MPRPKGLRHGFGIKAVTSEVPLNMTQKWLGHSRIATTAIYTNATGPKEKQIAERGDVAVRLIGSETGVSGWRRPGLTHPALPDSRAPPRVSAMRSYRPSTHSRRSSA